MRELQVVRLYSQRQLPHNRHKQRVMVLLKSLLENMERNKFPLPCVEKALGRRMVGGKDPAKKERSLT